MMYGIFMKDSIQVAFVLPSSDVRAIDALVRRIDGPYASRSEALRAAVRLWLDDLRSREVDAALEAGYAVKTDDDMSGLAGVSIEGLADARLDW